MTKISENKLYRKLEVEGSAEGLYFNYFPLADEKTEHPEVK